MNGATALWLAIGAAVLVCALAVAVQRSSRINSTRGTAWDGAQDTADDDVRVEARFAADWQADANCSGNISEEARRKKAKYWERQLRRGAKPFGS